MLRLLILIPILSDSQGYRDGCLNLKFSAALAKICHDVQRMAELATHMHVAVFGMDARVKPQLLLLT